MTGQKLQLSNETQISILSGDGHRVVEVRELREQFSVDALIRLHTNEFKEFMTLTRRYTHFNLERTLIEVGKRYAILPIVQAGYRDSKNREVLPVCDATQYRKGLCLEVAQGVQMGSIPARHFEYSLPSIRNPDQLKATLVRRYAPLFPDISEEELLSRGCAISVLDLGT